MGEEILRAIEQAFPYVPRPEQLVIHTGPCAHCGMTEQLLAKYLGPELPFEATRDLWDELDTLSPAAMRWVMASYLRHVATGGDEVALRTEFLIYALGPAPTRQEEVKQSFADFGGDQLRTLLTMINHLSLDPKWVEYCPKELQAAKLFLEALLQ